MDFNVGTCQGSHVHVELKRCLESPKGMARGTPETNWSELGFELTAMIALGGFVTHRCFSPSCISSNHTYLAPNGLCYRSHRDPGHGLRSLLVVNFGETAEMRHL